MILDGDGSLSLEALNWLSEQSVSLVQIDWQGQVPFVGGAAATYFRYWFGLPLKWRGITQKTIPIEWKTIGTRIGKNNSNQFSQHPVNTLFNYAYGVLENQVRTQIISMGADPQIGYIHNVKKNRDSFIYDLMEPVRPLWIKKFLSLFLTIHFHLMILF